MSRNFFKFCVIYFLCSPKLSEPKTESPRVYNGRQTSHKFFPFAISMVSYAPNVRRWHYSCGGSLISEWTVLTAAHCVVSYPSYPAVYDQPFVHNDGSKIVPHNTIVYQTVEIQVHFHTNKLVGTSYGLSDVEFVVLRCVSCYGNEGSACVPNYPGNLVIVAGADYVWQPSEYKQQSYAKSITVHPKCYFHQSSVLAFDTAVLVLQKPFVWSDYVKPFRLFSKDIETNLREFDRIARSGGKCYVVGYGQTAYGRLSDFIQLGEMTLMTNPQCNQKFCQYNRVFCNEDFANTGWACASTGVSTPCPGDSGGPLVCNEMVFGVVNWGRGCFSDLSNPAVFADMAAITYMVNLFDAGQKQRQRSSKQNGSGNLQLRWSYHIILLLAFPLLLR